ncbi:hypothetical protein BT96DRAFT_296544 [Gymnopus androsaceus JB14]|uniref:Uncharacterized protein n=1 Tax=Gymnopus androsaceus JB14 TaxID=1447944 RepID=A0A6A4H2C3_9AGAR|nr:hypothetical protein BT96DRAFT_296544 [Gymnopus androsaceus JB14]
MDGLFSPLSPPDELVNSEVHASLAASEITAEEATILLQLAQAQESLYTIERRVLEQKIHVTRLLLQYHFMTASKLQEASKAAEADTAHIIKVLQSKERSPVPNAVPRAPPIKPGKKVRAVNTSSPQPSVKPKPEVKVTQTKARRVL